MCFRPAGADTVPVCPSCGKQVPIMGGVVLKKCPHCKADMPSMDEAASPAAPSAPAAPGAPSAPKPPSA